MNPNNPFTKGPLVWILAAGILVGAGATATVMSSKKGTPIASGLPAPTVSVSEPKPVGQLKTESLDMVKALDESFANLADAAKPAVVHIRVQNSGNRNMYGERQAIGGEGSGFIFRPDGYILTNDHVVGGFEKVTVILFDGREFPGKVLRVEDNDIAVVKIDAKDLPTLPMADSSQVRAGEFAIAIGAPFGLESTVTIGHISATQRMNRIPDPNSGKMRDYTDLIQTDAPINVGNSGGPLLNIEGQVVGINSAIFSPTGTSGGIGFAISSNQARLLAETVIDKGKVDRGYMGVVPENLKLYQAKAMGQDSGALLTVVGSDSPAALGGLKEGDIVVRIGTLPIKSQVDLRNAMIKYGPGSKVDVEVVREKEHKTFSISVKQPPPPKSQQQPQVQMPDMDDFQGFKAFPKVDSPDNFPALPGNARLGVEVGNVDATSRKTYDIPSGVTGAVVNSVAPNSVADRVGLKPGDVISEVAGQKVSTAEDLANAMKKVNWGDTKSIKFHRSEKGASVTMERTIKF
jgi:serine protease Do